MSSIVERLRLYAKKLIEKGELAERMDLQASQQLKG